MATETSRPIPEMTDREIIEETLVLLWLFAEALGAVAANPMAAMMMPPTVRDSLKA